MASQFSRSENAGVELIPADALKILSVGISTGGVAEMRMTALKPSIKIIATTLDSQGIELANKIIAEKGMDSQIETKLEDVSKPLPYPEAVFDYIYARLVLHYLSKQELDQALAELRRVLKEESRLFVVVRSNKCPDATRQGATYDPASGLTTYRPHGKVYSSKRYFHSEESICRHLKKAGFEIETVKSYDEKLFKDFMRTEPADHMDNVIEVVALKK